MHCTHGVNRTGYMVCRYMISKLGFTPDLAIAGGFPSPPSLQPVTPRPELLQNVRLKSFTIHQKCPRSHDERFAH